MRETLVKLAAALAALLLCHAAQALNPDIPLEDLNHSSWTEKDGVPSDIQAMAQTRDGWLWLGTSDGLYRFDGVNFERYPLKRSRIYSLHAQDNDLLISYDLEGLVILRADGTLTELANPDGQKLGAIASMATDREGAVWAVSVNGLHRYARGQWRTLASGVDWADRSLSLLIDQYGQVWAANQHALYRYDRSTDSVLRVGDDALHGSLLQSPDGRTWISNGERVLPVPSPATGAPQPRQPDLNAAESRAYGQFDRDGNLWGLSCPHGVCRLARAGDLPSAAMTPARQASDRLDQHWQLSALTTNSLLEDREGNIWIATKSGLDRFRENKLLPARIPGIASSFSTATDADGKLWVAEWVTRSVWQVTAGGAPVRDPGRSASVLAKDRDGALLLAGARDIERVYQGRSSRIALPMPDGKPRDLTVLGMLDGASSCPRGFSCRQPAASASSGSATTTAA